MNRYKTRAALILSCVVYVAVLNWTYVHVVSPNFDSMGYTYRPPPFPFLVFSWLMAVAPSLWLPIALSRPSQVVYWILYLMVLVPAFFVPFYTLDMDPSQLVWLELCLFGAFGLLGCIYRLPLLRLPRVQVPRVMFWFLIALLSLGFYAYIVSVFGFQLKLVSLLEVYELRSEYKDALSDSGGLVAYAVGWQAYVINPLLIARGLISMNSRLMFLGILGQLVIFSITGLKSVFFSGLLVMALLVVIRSKGKSLGLTMVWGGTGGIVACIAADLILGLTFFSDVFIRRLIVTPGLLTGYYYEFFSNNPKTLLSYGILSRFVENPYSMTPNYLIGYIYFGRPDLSANVNLWADGYASFGYMGLFGATVVLALALWVFDSIARNRDYRLTSLMLGVPGYALANAAVLTSLLTHGIGLASLIVYLMPRRDDYRMPRGRVFSQSTVPR